MKHTHFSSSTGHAERGYYLPASHVVLISPDHCIYNSATTLTDKAYLLFLLSYVVVDEKLKNAASEVCVLSLEMKSVPSSAVVGLLHLQLLQKGWVPKCVPGVP